MQRSNRLTRAFRASIAMLSLSKTELTEFLRRNAEGNPFLLVADAPAEQADLKITAHGSRLQVELGSFPQPLLALRVAETDSDRSQQRQARWLVQKFQGYIKLLRCVGIFVAAEQKAFLSGKSRWPRRLKLEQLTRATGLHPSTIARLLKNKVVQTPHGLFSLGFLVSPFREPERIRKAILAMIAQADGSPPSDGEIARRLRAEGLEIARRTVCQFRNEDRYEELL